MIQHKLLAVAASIGFASIACISTTCAQEFSIHPPVYTGQADYQEFRQTPVYTNTGSEFVGYEDEPKPDDFKVLLQKMEESNKRIAELESQVGKSKDTKKDECQWAL